MFFEGKSLQKHLGNIYTDPKGSLVEESLNYLKLQKDKNENISLYELDAFSFMMMDLDEMEKRFILLRTIKRERQECRPSLPV